MAVRAFKLAVLTSHPIQYQAPFFKKMAQHPVIDLTVYFCWDFGRETEQRDPEFGRKIKWDLPLLEDYRHSFLTNLSLKPSSQFWGQVNPGIIAEIFSKKYDAVLIFGWNSFTNWLAFAAAFMTKTPVFLKTESSLKQELLKPKWKLKMKEFVLGRLFKRIDAFLYIGSENKKFYKHYGVPEKKLFFCPYAVDNERFMQSGSLLSASRRELRKKLGIGDKDLIVLFVGKLIEKKRPIDLLEACRRLTTNKQQLKVVPVFVGDGALRSELENYAQKSGLKAFFAGFKNQTELPDYYAMADIFVLPSGEGETWGLVVNEAMCFGLPVLVSDMVGCAPDLVKEGENGFIFRSGDYNSLANCLVSLINSEVGLSEFKRESREIIKKYSYEKDIESLVAALNSLREGRLR